MCHFWRQLLEKESNEWTRGCSQHVSAHRQAQFKVFCKVCAYVLLLLLLLACQFVHSAPNHRISF